MDSYDLAYSATMIQGSPFSTIVGLAGRDIIQCVAGQFFSREFTADEVSRRQICWTDIHADSIVAD